MEWVILPEQVKQGSVSDQQKQRVGSDSLMFF
jgi:hypothetical protein